MTFDDLLGWFAGAFRRLSSANVPQERVRHLSRMYVQLRRANDPKRFEKDWKQLAQRVAARLGEEPPTIERFQRGPSQTNAIGKRQPPTRPRLESSKRRPRAAVQPVAERLESNAQLDAAFAAIEKRRPIIFVTGGAGTGKSTFIREVRARFPKRNLIVLAPTGVAALTAGGQTVHSFCQLPLRPVRPDDVKEAQHPEVVTNLDLLVLDEVSMVRADVFDGLERFLRINRKSNEPFGGVQVVLVGDLFQLPPVVTAQDRPFIEHTYESPHFFSSTALRGLSFYPVELETVYRQKETEFASLLRDVRDGTRLESAVGEINRRCVGRSFDGQHLTLVPTRNAAAEENERRLAALPGKERRYNARVEGTFTRGEDRQPAPETLILKTGAQVMFVRNDYPEKRWVNGTLGVVDRLGKDSVRVRVGDGEIHDVEPVEWQNVRYRWDAKEKKILEDVLGSFVQYPLIPAWAVTIHKAQGLTLSRVTVDLGRGAFAEGQVYVALSRCESLDGLSLTRPVRLEEIRCSTAARNFYSKLRRKRTTERPS